MKKFNKPLALLMALMILLALSACGGAKTGSASSSDVKPAASPAASPKAESAASPEDLGLVTEGKLTMGTNAEFPPYEYYEGNVVVGIDAEIAAAIAEKLGLELVIEDMEFDSIIPSVKGGKIDIGMAGMTVTDERLEEVNFTTSYATGVQVIIVQEGSPIKTADDLFGDGNYTIGVQLVTTGDLYATWDIEDEGLGTVDRYNKGADAVMALKDGKVDCVIIDNEPAKAFVAANEGLKILETEYAVEDYAIALAKENTVLYEKINAALEELIADGTVQKIIDKYINKG